MHRRLRGDRGEGVISAAIAVLIVAFLGAAMWVTFNGIWGNVKTNTCSQIASIGGGGAGGTSQVCP